MKIYNSLYIFGLTIAILIILCACRSTRPASTIWLNPLDYAYDSLMHSDSVAVRNIKAFVKYIDSLSDNDESQKFIIKSISEGTITQETITTSIVGHDNKIDTIRKTRIGGFGKYTTKNVKGDTVYKILYHDNIDKNFYEIHYYKDNKLVYSKIDYQEDGIGQTFYYKEEYYSDDNVLLVIESSKSIDPVVRQRVNFDLRKKGYEYLAEFRAKSK